MLDKLTANLDFNGKALMLRADRQRILASNIANVDTPGYIARDFKFADALQQATQGSTSLARQALYTGSTQGGSNNGNARHIAFNTDTSSELDKSALGYSLASQPSLDGNSVDMDRERAAFADNSIRYEATLRFINGHAKTMLSAIQGQ
jgi:flagellar basal-body rod protein FlgB